ncbi:uncharacterized protein PHALS_14877 [Plasmopara halstedii]|uniref:Uncharacterized protein n=1 Tax=Plasmopara halstedii TaxID=4781 RepID=A0A0N7L755_PLAHL|nr:uncharacterized protein PHALS_14877 [Plasmopara halstedii]CEG46131.1 hypothetical protein PHALS_14877 [Plasmopara halstedii]|eukprot:XP_024582500.1 hypothetical protein PHALS_14877 [Plasmopara halstedii]
MQSNQNVIETIGCCNKVSIRDLNNTFKGNDDEGAISTNFNLMAVIFNAERIVLDQQRSL